MAKERPTAEKGVEDRVLAYGDRAVGQGQATTANPTAQPQPVKPPTPVDLILVDPRGAVPSSVPAALAAEIGAVRRNGWTAPLSGMVNAVFQARKRGMTSQQERFQAGKMDYTFYLVEGHSSAASSWKEVNDWLLDHGLIDAGRGRAYFEIAKSAWEDSSKIGFGMPPQQGYAKAAVVKVDALRKSAKSLPIDRAMLNVLKHEFAHMCGADHGSAGIMLPQAPLAGTPAYDDKAMQRIFLDLARLIASQEAQLKAAYERGNL